MQCQHAHELFSDYVDGQLDRPLVVTVDNHLEQCSTCREAVAGLRRIWTDLKEMPAAEPPPFFHENLMYRLNKDLDSQEANAARRRGLWDWRAMLRPRAMVAAGALALVLLFTGAGILHTQPASMWPFSLFGSHNVAPHVAIIKPAVQWTQDEVSASGGTLTVRLQLDNTTTASSSDVDYTINIESADPGSTKSAVGMFLPDGTATARLQLTAAPDAGRDTLVVTVKARKDGQEGRQVWRQQLQLRN